MTPLPAGTAVQADLPGRYLALPAQRGMILNYLRFPGDGIDVIQATLDWDTPLEPEPFEAAWQLVARRHGIMRTTFRVDERDGLVQVADPYASFDVRRRDLPWPPASGPDHAFESFLRKDPARAVRADQAAAGPADDRALGLSRR